MNYKNMGTLILIIGLIITGYQSNNQNLNQKYLECPHQDFCFDLEKTKFSVSLTDYQKLIKQETNSISSKKGSYLLSADFDEEYITINVQNEQSQIIDKVTVSR